MVFSEACKRLKLHMTSIQPYWNVHSDAMHTKVQNYANEMAMLTILQMFNFNEKAMQHEV